jgi:hypothetical protein
LFLKVARRFLQRMGWAPKSRGMGTVGKSDDFGVSHNSHIITFAQANADSSGVSPGTHNLRQKQIVFHREEEHTP